MSHTNKSSIVITLLKKEITFDELVKAVKVTSEASQASALKAINRMLTMRNWLIGYYIVEFEQKGKERAHMERNCRKDWRSG